MKPLIRKVESDAPNRHQIRVFPLPGLYSSNSMLTPSSEEELLIGTKIAERYEILAVLGRGSMGIVYKAKHEKMDRTVAIKTLRAQYVSDERTQKRFEREARATSRLDHPNIITVHDYGVTEKRLPYLVMDYIKGTNLYDVWKREGHLQPPRAVHIFTQVCDALHHAHQRGVIHRDLKPANIMLVEKDGDPDFVRVVDLGIAKIAFATDEEHEAITNTGEVCGSPVYLSPEQCKNEVMDARSDVYALGVVMYEMLTGRPPLIGDTVHETIYAHVHEQPRLISQVRPDLSIPRRLEAVVMKALEKQPSDRYQSMLEVREDLIASMRHQDAMINVLPPDALLSKVLSMNVPIPTLLPPHPTPQGQQRAVTNSRDQQLAPSTAWGQTGRIKDSSSGAGRTQPERISGARQGGLKGGAKDGPFSNPAVVAVISAVTAVIVTLLCIKLLNVPGERAMHNAQGSGTGSYIDPVEAPDYQSSPPVMPPPRRSQPVKLRRNQAQPGGSAKTAARPAKNSSKPPVTAAAKPPAGAKQDGQGNWFFSIFSGGKDKSGSPAAPPNQQHVDTSDNGTAPVENTPPAHTSATSHHSKPLVAARTHETTAATTTTATATAPPAIPNNSSNSSGSTTTTSTTPPPVTPTNESASPLRSSMELNNSGVEAMKQGAYEDAIQKFTEALKQSPSYTKAKLNLAIAYQNHAMTLQTGGRAQDAEHFYKLALAIFDKVGGPAAAYAQQTSSNLAGLLRSQGRNAEADHLSQGH